MDLFGEARKKRKAILHNKRKKQASDKDKDSYVNATGLPVSRQEYEIMNYTPALTSMCTPMSQMSSTHYQMHTRCTPIDTLSVPAIARINSKDILQGKKKKVASDKGQGLHSFSRHADIECDTPFRSWQCTPLVNNLSAHNQNYTTPFQTIQFPSQQRTNPYNDKNKLDCFKPAFNIRRRSSLQTNLMNKFGKENYNVNTDSSQPTTLQSSSSTVKSIVLPRCSTQIQSGKYTVDNSRLITHLTDDDTDEIADAMTDYGEDNSSHSDHDGESNTDSHFQHTAKNCDSLPAYKDLGDPIWTCRHCKAKMWYAERINKNRQSKNPRFYLCCGDGKIQLPLLQDPPEPLCHLLFDNNTRQCKNFQANIRSYNAMFAFTSAGAKLDTRIITGRGPPAFCIQGQAHHLIGSLIPMTNKPPKFSQLYIYDTENEIQNRLARNPNKDALDEQIVIELKNMLDKENEYAKKFRMARDKVQAEPVCELKLRLIRDRQNDGRVYNMPLASEVAALIVGDELSGNPRDIILEKQSGRLKRIDELYPGYLSLQYPLLFPRGEDGYRPNIPHNTSSNSKTTKKRNVTLREYFCYRLQTRENESQAIQRSKRLFQQFVVDGYQMMESQRLNFVKNHQQQLRVDKYINLNSSSNQTQSNGIQKGKRIILPSSYVGSRRYMDQIYFDGMAICAHLGFPDLFITFTCNPTWPELVRKFQEENCTPHDRPDYITRIFKMKLEDLISNLKHGNIFGKILGYVYTVEWQKRGLPHAHILLFLHPANKYPNPQDIDRIISAEIPDKFSNPDLYDLVSKHMIHGPCGRAFMSSPCMKDGKCSKFFPKSYQLTTIVDQDGFPVYRRRDTGHVVERNGVQLDNQYVVPYNPMLLLKYRAHLNVEWCNQSTSIKYLFKYINKGSDRITAAIVNVQNEDGTQSEIQDEIKHYLDCRYVSPPEACFRIFAFNIHGRAPSVERLYFHLQDQQAVYWTDTQDIDTVLAKSTVKESMFTSWMESNKKYPQGRDLTYSQYVSKFVYIKHKRCWQPRKHGFTIGRLIWVPPSSGELFYLRMMLCVAKGPQSYNEIKTVNQVQYQSFREACFAMGFLGNDQEFIGALEEANRWGTPYYLRKLFVKMLFMNSLDRPEYVWQQTWQWLADDIAYTHRRQGCHLSEDDLKNLCLHEIEKLLQGCRRSLKDFPCMPYPIGYAGNEYGNKLINAEKSYDKEALKQVFDQCYSSLTDEQSDIFHKIMHAVDHQTGGVFFLYGYGGTGKTFVWKTLASAIRSQDGIVLTVASSGIASLLLPGGRTAHSKFAIPIPSTETSTCNIHQGSEIAELLQLTKLIIWDEAPMCHKHSFEALDKTLKDIMRNDQAFGGKVIVFGGDFRQILPVVPKGTRADIVHASINSSYIWDQCQILRLTRNMRLQNNNSHGNSESIKQFSEWLLNVGDGNVGQPNDGHSEITIPEEFLIKDYTNPLEAIVKTTYPDLLQQYTDEHFLQSRAVLAATVDTVDSINEYVMSFIPGEQKEYYSADSIDVTDQLENPAFETLTPEFLNSLKASGLPNHKLILKIGTPIMLLRNLDQSDGLCNGTRLITTRLGKHVIEAKIITGSNMGHTTYIPRMNLTPSDSPWPFKLIRRQFPFMVSFAMTINKSQGQSLAHVGLYLPKPVFSHGQLYVALSRVQSKEGLHILIHDKDGKPMNTTTNVVFKEVFNNL